MYMNKLTFYGKKSASAKLPLSCAFRQDGLFTVTSPLASLSTEIRRAQHSTDRTTLCRFATGISSARKSYDACEVIVTYSCYFVMLWRNNETFCLQPFVLSSVSP